MKRVHARSLLWRSGVYCQDAQDKRKNPAIRFHDLVHIVCFPPFIYVKKPHDWSRSAIKHHHAVFCFHPPIRLRALVKVEKIHPEALWQVLSDGFFPFKTRHEAFHKKRAEVTDESTWDVFKPTNKYGAFNSTHALIVWADWSDICCDLKIGLDVLQCASLVCVLESV